MTTPGAPRRDPRDPRVDPATRTGITDLTAVDEQGELVHAVGGIGMPTTVFVRPGGEIAEIWVGALDAGAFRELVAEHLGVVP